MVVSHVRMICTRYASREGGRHQQHQQQQQQGATPWVKDGARYTKSYSSILPRIRRRSARTTKSIYNYQCQYFRAYYSFQQANTAVNKFIPAVCVCRQTFLLYTYFRIHMAQSSLVLFSLSPTTTILTNKNTVD